MQACTATNTSHPAQQPTLSKDANWTHEQYSRTRTGRHGANRKSGTAAQCKLVETPIRNFCAALLNPDAQPRRSLFENPRPAKGSSEWAVGPPANHNLRLLIPLLAHRILARPYRNRHHNAAISIESQSVIPLGAGPALDDFDLLVEPFSSRGPSSRARGFWLSGSFPVPGPSQPWAGQSCSTVPIVPNQ